MKKAWILKLIFICSLLLLGERISKNPVFQASSHTFIQTSDKHSEAIVAIELEDEVEDALTVFFASNSFDWVLFNQLFVAFSLVVFFSRPFFHPIPEYLRFHNLRL